MASFSYDRAYRLTIETPPKFLPVVEDTDNTPLENTSLVFTNKVDYREIISSNALLFTDLHFKATVSFTGETSGSDPAEGTIEIYNLSQEHRNDIIKTNGIVILEAGYGDDLDLIFSGQIFKSSVRREGENVITTLKCKDGNTALTGIRYAKSFPKDTPYSTIFNDMADAFVANGIARASNGIILDPPTGVPYSRLKLPPAQVKTVKSYSATGYLRQALEALCKEFDYTYQIIHTRLYIYPLGYPEMVGQVEFNSDNILSLREYQDSTDSTPTDAKSQGIELQVLLNGDINLTKLVKIVDDGTNTNVAPYTGTYRIRSGRHELDYEGQAWYTTVICDGIKGA